MAISRKGMYMKRKIFINRIPKKLPLAIALALNAMGVSAQFHPAEELSQLNGSNGFVINGVAAFDYSGRSVSAAGDVNGDGIDDLIIGAYDVNTNGSNSGASYVVFGSDSGFNPSLNLSSLNGSNGFVINGVTANDYSGQSVSAAGDVNGDDLDDLIIGAYGVDTNGDFSGASYVVFGSDSGFNSSLELRSLNGSNGFTINGTAIYDASGQSVSTAGDVNGDGLDDLIIGGNGGVDTNGDFSGASYVVFGSDSGFNATLELSSLNGSNGFVINGVATNDDSGRSVSAAGDVNGDGLDDLIIGATGVGEDINGPGPGASYVVFGSNSGFNASLNLSALNGSNGFVINGLAAGHALGISVSTAGDFNGDGIDDLIIGAAGIIITGDFSFASYVVFGSDSGFNSTLDLSSLNGSNGFVIAGINSESNALKNRSVSTAGDVNGDGLDDVIIGSSVHGDDTNGSYSGDSYVVFGNDSGFSTYLALNSINGSNGFVINGAATNDFSGQSVSTAGDVNGDGLDDIIIGADGVDTNGNSSGASYVVFGNDVIFSNDFE